MPALFFSACGSKSSGGTPPPTTYTIGGTISDLSGSGLVLQNNGGDNLQVSSTQTTFVFATSVASGAAYAVTILTQPSSPAQTCTVTNGSGTATANVTSVQVACTANPTTNVWTWVGGANTINQTGIYGTKGTAAPGNIPGARDSAVSWADPSGNIWLFGGETNGSGLFNDLWKLSSGQWTWIGGSNTVNQVGTYGTQGTANPANIPGARSNAVGWSDAAGNVWLFGGYGIDSAGNTGDLNDLWEYNAGQWTWIDGSNIINQQGSYGTQGVSGVANIPGARYNPTTWTDKAGNFWLFGGVGYDTNGSDGQLNDLWKFSAGQWTWMSGSINAKQSGIYGTQGMAAATNVPGARSASAAWADASGNLWLFGGGGYDSTGSLGYLNDLWEYSAGQWTWIGGSNLANQPATYGTQGTAAPANIPAGRFQFVSWIDPAGNFWFFGGQGLDSAGSTGRLNDLWKYSSGEWTWVSGANLIGQSGAYGTQGVAAASNIPGSRQEQVGWVDSAGNFWLFGGLGNSGSTTGYLNDLWEYQP
jgi:N-acetylneuraminic acid mutarotase